MLATRVNGRDEDGPVDVADGNERAETQNQREQQRGYGAAEHGPDSDAINFGGDDLPVDSRFRLPDGRLGTYEELVAVAPAIFESGEGVTPVFLVIPGSRYRAVEARELVAELVLVIGFLVLGALIISRRRPT